MKPQASEEPADKNAATEDSKSEKPCSTKEGVEKPKQAENLCCYSQKECHLEKLKGFDFCHKHILEDKASPFKPCSFISKTNGKRCQNPAPNLSDREKTYCLIHTRDSELRKAVEERSSKKRKRKHGDHDELSDSMATKGIHSSQSNNNVKNLNKKQKIMEGGDFKRDDMIRVDSSWHGDYESDAESLDNELDDPLRHAGVWTAEEVAKIYRDKLLRLRSLYMAQFERLKHVFKNKRRKYMAAAKANEEGDANVTKKKASLSAFEIATKSYNKRYRMEALLQKQSKDKRSGVTSRSYNQILPHQRCTHYSDGNRCVYKVIPSTKFCVKHICHDPNQVLFLPCSHIMNGAEHCGVAVANVSSHEKCLLHLPHLSELTGSNLKEELQRAKDQQIVKEKEEEDRRKTEIQKPEFASTNSALSSEKSTSGTPDVPKPKEEPKATTGLRNTINKTKQLLETSIPVSSDAPGLLKSTSHSSLSKQPQSPTTNLQIRIQPLKKPEIVFTDVTPNSPHKSMESLDKVLGAGAEQSQSEAGKVKEPKPGVAIQNTVNSSVMAPNATPEIPDSDCSNVKQGNISFIPVSSKFSIPKVKDISESIMVKDGGSSSDSKEQSDSDRQDSVKSNSNISSTASK